MALLLFIVMPLGFLLLSKLLGCSVAASFFYSERGKQRGKIVSAWCMPILPAVYLLLMVTGGGGNAGYGITIFGSDFLFEFLAGTLFYAVPVLALYAGFLYVARDLTLGHQTRAEEQ